MIIILLKIKIIFLIDINNDYSNTNNLNSNTNLRKNFKNTTFVDFVGFFNKNKKIINSNTIYNS